MPYLRLAHALTAEELERPGLLDPSPGNRVISVANEQAVLHQLLLYFQRRLSQCVHPTLNQTPRLLQLCTWLSPKLSF